MMEKIAEKAGLTIEWAKEVNFGSWTQELEAGRFDVACTPMWPAISLGRKVLFTKPMFFSQMNVIGRSDETRFTTLADVNKPDVKITVTDANDTFYLAKEWFPNATITSQPQNADGTQVIMDVISRKADVMISDWNAAAQWNQKNDQKLAVVAGGVVLKAMPFTLAVKATDVDLGNYLNMAIDDLNNTGAINRILEQWMEYKGVFLPVATPYKQ
jgi:polar amino acid transport system substrate-binding protein